MVEKIKELTTEDLVADMESANRPPPVTHTSQIVSKSSEHPKFIELIVKMLSKNVLPYYAEFSTFINFHETTSIPTCGVNVTSKGMNFYWNRDFVDSLTLAEAMFLLIHEDFHLLFDHTKRSIFYNKELANIAQDMIINQVIQDDIIVNFKSSKYGDDDMISIPKVHDEFIMDKNKQPVLDKNGNKIPNPMFNKNTGLFIPKEFTGEPIFEDLYEYLREKQADHKKRREEQDEQKQCEKKPGDDEDGGQGQPSDEQGEGGQGQEDGQGKGQPSDEQGEGQGKGQGKGQPSDKQGGGGQGQPSDEQGEGQGQAPGEPTDSFGKPSYGNNGRNNVDCNSLDSIFDGLEKGEQLTLDSHIEDDVQEEARKSVVNDFMQRLKNRGLVSAEIESTLNKLRKSKKDYLKEIKRTVSSHIVGTSKRKSITKPNRRGIEGLKGKKKYKNIVNVILDTSGSMGGDFERVLAYVFQNDIQINLIQIDAEVKECKEIKNKRELQKAVIYGGGGTALQPAINYISKPENKIHKNNNIILTDGYTDTLNFTNIIGKNLILSTGVKSPTVDPKKSVKSIIIDKDNSLYN